MSGVIACALVAVAACSAPARPDARGLRYTDLTAEFLRADRPIEIQPPNAASVRDAIVGGVSAQCIATTPPSRVTWPLAIPPRARLHTAIAVRASEGAAGTAMFRIGIADARYYEELFRREVAFGPGAAPDWVPAAVDLSSYAGPQWSLFYHPSRRTWRIILATSTAPPAPGSPAVLLLWRAPDIRVER